MKDNLIRPEDFLMDDSFLEYCIGNKPELIIAWDKWIENNPDRQDALNKAKRMFAMMNGHDGNVEPELLRFRALLREREPEQFIPATEKPQLSTTRRIPLFSRWKIAVAAIFLLVAGASVVWYMSGEKTVTTGQHPIAQNQQTDVLPGVAKAKLTMGDGRSVELDSIASGQLYDKDGTLINKEQGILVYDDATSNSETILYNTLSTPRGGEYQLVLPDGSKVWLNAASSLRFPTKFAGAVRTVYLTGEAYFEVTKNAKQPFHVEMENGMQVEVLGTQFNVMAYTDENAIKTTLVEGKVNVKKSGKMVQLRPSQQSVLQRSSQQLSVAEADVSREISWKLGYFEFEDEDLYTVMRQLARWYDLDVVIVPGIPDKHYAGSISRKLTLVKVLQILKLAGVQYTIEGQKITIKKV
jgi:transmembrane sensor